MTGCPLCRTSKELGWLCAEHPGMPWEHDDCHADGAPCVCNPAGEVRWREIYAEIDAPPPEQLTRLGFDRLNTTNADRLRWTADCAQRLGHLLPDLTPDDTDQLATSLWLLARSRDVAPVAAADKFFSSLTKS